MKEFDDTTLTGRLRHGVKLAKGVEPPDPERGVGGVKRGPVVHGTSGPGVRIGNDEITTESLRETMREGFIPANSADGGRGRIPEQITMEAGKRYELRFRRSKAEHRDRIDVLTYLADGQGMYRHCHVMDARPLAGTQHFPKAWVRGITEVPMSTPIRIDNS